jgi:hypothetical protein
MKNGCRGDSRAHGGDGLGPVSIDGSCIARRNLVGTGGGPGSKYVDIITASPNNNMMPQPPDDSGRGEPGFSSRPWAAIIPAADGWSLVVLPSES